MARTPSQHSPDLRADSQRGPERASVDITDAFSEQTQELLQKAAQRAVAFGKREVDTEHLLDALWTAKWSKPSSSRSRSHLTK